MPARRGIAPLADISDCECRYGPPECANTPGLLHGGRAIHGPVPPSPALQVRADASSLARERDDKPLAAARAESTAPQAALRSAHGRCTLRVSRTWAPMAAWLHDPLGKAADPLADVFLEPADH